MPQPKIALIIGSGPNAPEAQGWDRAAFDDIVAINNAWRVREDWDYLIHPEDFPEDRHPNGFGAGQVRVTYRDYVPAQNSLGGFVFAGGTMAFTAGYWALAALKPDVLAFIGCDMVFPKSGDTHFYGTGAADPLRDDVTLQSLEGKSARLGLLAARAGCACVNLSQQESRLVFPKMVVGDLVRAQVMDVSSAVNRALAREADLGYFVESGRYWKEQHRFDATALADLDAQWLAAYTG